MYLPLSLTLIGLCATTSIAKAASSTTWLYTGVIDRIGQNDLNFAVPLGSPVSIQLTFNPLTPDTNPHPGANDYLMSGGDTTLRVSIGPHESTPVSQFRIAVLPEGCCAANDQYNFLDFDTQGGVIDIDFPGYLTNAETQLFFRRRHTPGPITSPALPSAQPNPLDFHDARLAFFKNRSDPTNRLVFTASLNGVPVPEPSALALAAILGGAAIRVITSRYLRAGDVSLPGEKGQN